MPIFNFKCKQCGAAFEALLRRFDDNCACEVCGGKELEKLPSAPGSVGVGASSGPCSRMNQCPAASHSCGHGGKCGCH